MVSFTKTIKFCIVTSHTETIKEKSISFSHQNPYCSILDPHLFVFDICKSFSIIGYENVMAKAVDTTLYPEDKNVVAGPENFNKAHFNRKLQ